MASEVQRWKDWYFWWQTKRKATRSGYQWNWIGTWGIKWWWRVMRDFADKFDINVSVPTIHQIITNKILTFKKFVHDGCPHCCLRMKNRGGFLHSASFYDDGRKKVTRFLAELSPRMRTGYLILTRKPNNNQACGRGKGPRHRRKPEWQNRPENTCLSCSWTWEEWYWRMPYRVDRLSTLTIIQRYIVK